MMDNLEIKKFMAGQLNAGNSLSDIQKMVNEKFGTKYSYMEIRIMASELENIDWGKNDPKPEKKDEPAPAAPADPAAAPATAPAAKATPGAPVPPLAAAAGGGKTTVEISKLVRPGAAMSGSAKFASGASAEWVLDQMGRLGLENVVGTPTEEDMRAFVDELKRVLQGQP